MNLMTSYEDEESVTENLVENKATAGSIENIEDTADVLDWLGEFEKGCEWEIYTTELPSYFEGYAFGQIAEVLYMKVGIVLFGIEVECLSNGSATGGQKIFLNPADFIIPSQADYRIIALVIAKSQYQAESCFRDGSAMEESVNISPYTGLKTTINTSSSQNAANYRAPGSVSPLSLKRAAANRKQDRLAWRNLLRRYEVPKRSEMIQEENQKLDNLYLREHYYCKDHIMDMQDAVVKTSLQEEMPMVENHIIIIGKSLSSLYDLILPLRSKRLGALRHIIILYPYDFPIDIWQRIAIFESIWLLRGSPLEEEDIRRSGIFKAKQVLLLADISAFANYQDKNNLDPNADLGSLLDADVIFCYRSVRMLNENAHIVVDIVRNSNISYLDPDTHFAGVSNDLDYLFTPQFASGSLFVTSSLDSIISRVFHSRRTVDILNKFVGESERLDSELESQKFYNVRGLHSSSLYQIPLPEELESRTYGALFRLLSKRKQLPLGILRGVFSDTKYGPKANRMPYVFTNPDKDTELFNCDRVFILSQTPVKISRIVKDEVKELQIYANIRAKKKTTEDVLDAVNLLREELNVFKAGQIEMEKKIQTLSKDMNRKFSRIISALENFSNEGGKLPVSASEPSFHTSPPPMVKSASINKQNHFSTDLRPNKSAAKLPQVNITNKNKT